MSKRVKQAAVVFIILFAAAQLVRPERENPATDASRTIQAHAGTTSELVAVLDRSCRAHDHLHAELTRLRVRRLNIVSIEGSYFVRRMHALFRYRVITSKDARAVA